MKQSSQVLEGEQQREQIVHVLKKIKKSHNLVSENKFLNENLIETTAFYVANFEYFMSSLQLYTQYISKSTLEEHTKIKSVLSLYQATLFDNFEKSIPSSFQLTHQHLTNLEKNIHLYTHYLDEIKKVFPSYVLDSYYQQRQSYILNKIAYLTPLIYQLSENSEKMRQFYFTLYNLTRLNNSFLGKLN